MKLIQVSEHPEDRERDGSLILPKEAEGDEIQHQATKANISIRFLKLSFIFQSNHLQGRFLSPDKSLGIINTQHNHNLLMGDVLTRRDPTSKTDAQDGTQVQWQHSHLTSAQVECPYVVEIPLVSCPHDVVVQGHVGDALEVAEAQTLQECTILRPTSS